MATMIVKHRVANFEKWKAAFDSLDKVRKDHGWIGSTVHRDATDPNLVVIVNHVKDLAGAKKYGGSDALRTAMANGGVQGVPEITFLNDVA
jgi:hypothetical protein